jgi:hypothetical protein
VNEKFKRAVGGFSIGWSSLTVFNLLSHRAEPAGMYYADAVFFIIAVVTIVWLATSKPNAG